MIIYSCPDCDGDLVDEGFALWCPACQRTVPYACVQDQES